MKTRPWLLWVVSVVVTLASAVYQRMTGPTHPVRGRIVVGAEEIKYKLLRSYDGWDDAEIRLAVAAPDISGMIEYKRYRSHDNWTRETMQRQDGHLVGKLPHQPPAGKVLYRVFLGKAGQDESGVTAEPLVIRFRGAVTPFVLYPHIALMFIGMLCSARAGLEGAVGGERTHRHALWTVLFLTIGGMVLGPVVQKLAFGAYWTGWPFGHDLTDNKTLVAFLLWVIAFWRLRKNPRAGGWAIAAAITMLLVYAIPHSVLGSELDYTQSP